MAGESAGSAWPLPGRTLLICFACAFPLAVFWRQVFVPLILYAKARAPSNLIEGVEWLCDWAGVSRTTFKDALGSLERAIIWVAVNVNIWVLVAALLVIVLGVELGCGHKRRSGANDSPLTRTGDAQLDKELAGIHKDLDELMAELKDIDAMVDASGDDDDDDNDDEEEEGGEDDDEAREEGVVQDVSKPKENTTGEVLTAMGLRKRAVVKGTI